MKAVFHTLVYALEQRPGWTPAQRYAATVSHAVRGFLPETRYVQAAERAHAAAEGSIERWVGDWQATNANPFSQVFRNLSQPANLVASLNAFNRQARNLFARTIIEAGDPSDLASWRFSRTATAPADPPACATAAFVGYANLARRAAHNRSSRARPGIVPLSSHARLLGVEHGAAAQVVAVLEREGLVPTAAVARALGCSERTLQRQLRAEGVTLLTIRQAVRLLNATAALRSAIPLSDLALMEGFADLSHMDRAFRASTGVTPGLLRDILLGVAEAEPARA